MNVWAKTGSIFLGFYVIAQIVLLLLAHFNITGSGDTNLASWYLIYSVLPGYFLTLPLTEWMKGFLGWYQLPIVISWMMTAILVFIVGASLGLLFSKKRISRSQ